MPDQLFVEGLEEQIGSRRRIHLVRVHIIAADHARIGIVVQEVSEHRRAVVRIGHRVEDVGMPHLIDISRRHELDVRELLMKEKPFAIVLFDRSGLGEGPFLVATLMAKLEQDRFEVQLRFDEAALVGGRFVEHDLVSPMGCMLHKHLKFGPQDIVSISNAVRMSIVTQSSCSA